MIFKVAILQSRAENSNIKRNTDTIICSMDAIREYRSSEMMGNTFRKVNAYKGLLDAKISEPFIRAGQE